MIRKLAVPALLFLLLAAATYSFATCPACNLLINGGFETGDFTGWTITGDTTYIGVCDVSTCPGSFAPWDGAFAAYFGPVGNTATITQNIRTIKKKKYTLTFFLANPVGGSPTYFKASFGSIKPATYTLTNSPAFGWTQIKLIYTAQGPVTPVSFTFQQDPAYWFIDQIAVQPGNPPGEGEEVEGLSAIRMQLASGPVQPVQAGEEHSLAMNVFAGDAAATGTTVTFTRVLGDLRFVSGEVAAQGRQSEVRVDDHGQAAVRFIADQPGLSIIEVSCGGTKQRISFSATNIPAQSGSGTVPKQK